MEKITIKISIPKAIGDSKTVSVPRNNTLIEALLKLNQPILMDKIMKSSTEFNQFVLIYHNKARVKNTDFILTNDCNIDIIIPMAGG